MKFQIVLSKMITVSARFVDQVKQTGIIHSEEGEERRRYFTAGLGILGYLFWAISYILSLNP